jgi:hypothetical protein
MDDNQTTLKINLMRLKPKQRFVTRLDGFGSHREFIPEGFVMEADAMINNMFFCDDGWYFKEEFDQVEIEISQKQEVKEEE